MIKINGLIIYFNNKTLLLFFFFKLFKDFNTFKHLYIVK